jgi:hypothetical protein
MSARDVNPVSTHAALQALGFRSEPKVYSEQETGLSYDFGSFQLTAARMMNLQMREAWHLSGLIATSRSVAQIEFEMPLQVDSAEQCAAWIAWALEHQLPRNEKLVASLKQELMILGLQHQSTLPWFRQPIGNRFYRGIAIAQSAAPTQHAPL